MICTDYVYLQIRTNNMESDLEDAARAVAPRNNDFVAVTDAQDIRAVRVDISRVHNAIGGG